MKLVFYFFYGIKELFQLSLIEVPRPRLDFTGDNVEVEENVDLTHPVEGTSEIQHKTKRVVLNELLDRMSK